MPFGAAAEPPSPSPPPPSATLQGQRLGSSALQPTSAFQPYRRSPSTSAGADAAPGPAAAAAQPSRALRSASARLAAEHVPPAQLLQRARTVAELLLPHLAAGAAGRGATPGASQLGTASAAPLPPSVGRPRAALPPLPSPTSPALASLFAAGLARPASSPQMVLHTQPTTSTSNESGAAGPAAAARGENPTVQSSNHKRPAGPLVAGLQQPAAKAQRLPAPSATQQQPGSSWDELRAPGATSQQPSSGTAAPTAPLLPQPSNAELAWATGVYVECWRQRQQLGPRAGSEALPKEALAILGAQLVHTQLRKSASMGHLDG